MWVMRLAVAVLAVLTLAVLVCAPAYGAGKSPRATFTVTPAAPVTGQQVTFDASASACFSTGWANANCTSYRWDDDADSNDPLDNPFLLGTGRVLTRSFGGAGTKYVWLTLTDSAGRSTQTATPVVVTVAPAPTPTPTATPTPTPTPEPTPSPSPTPTPTPSPSPTPSSTPTATPTPTPSPTPTPTPDPGGCDRNATTSTFSAQWNAATGGQSICLAAGDYGQFNAGHKTGGRVTIRPETGATVNMSLDTFGGASNVTMDGITWGAFNLRGTTVQNVTIRNSTFTTGADVRADTWNQGNVLFDHNVHQGFREGTMLRFPVRGANPAGITVSNSAFTGGTADGIQTGANGLTIVDNTFLDIEQNDSICSACHTDVIQLIGAKNTVISRNFFRNVSVPLGGFDGPNDTILVEDNVIIDPDNGLSVNTLVVGAAVNTTIRHNTVAGPGSCIGSGNCGWIRLGNKSDAAGNGSVHILDNIVSKLVPEVTTVGTNTHNLYAAAGSPTGTNNLLGRPVFECGCVPSTYAEARLASVSLGYRNASDGLDRGARIP